MTETAAAGQQAQEHQGFTGLQQALHAVEHRADIGRQGGLRVGYDWLCTGGCAGKKSADQGLIRIAFD